MNVIRTVVISVVTAAVAFWAGGHFVQKQASVSDEPGLRKILYYTDPMNPGFRSDKPGKAPCGMPLEPVYAEGGGAEDSPADLPPDAVRINPYRQQLVGVKIVAVKPQPMTYTLRLYGKVVPDETQVYRVNASTDSWIRQISDVTTGSFVRKGQILAEALAPAYYNAQVTYLIALDNMDRIKQQLGGELRHQQGDLANNQVRVAVQALQNLGIGDAQIEELANTRRARPYLQVRAPTRGIVLKRNVTLNQWFKAAEEFYTIADIRHVWVYADVYENEARHLRPGMTVQIRHAQLGTTFDAIVSEVLPLFDPLSKTLKVRLDVTNPRYDLRPDMFVDVEIPVTMPPSLNVPADAVIDSGTKTIVYVETGDGVFEPRRVETGWRLGRRVQITGGLMPDENVVVAGNFLLDSESRMKTAASPLEVAVARDPVCGMDVEKEEADRSGMTAHYNGRTYYFCSESCRDFFAQEALAASGKPHAPQLGPAHASPPVKVVQESGWGAPQSKAGKTPVPAQQPADSAGVIDWDGPGKNDSKRDWSGWGKFPGAEYLGLKQHEKKMSGQKPGVFSASSGTLAERPLNAREMGGTTSDSAGGPANP